MCRAVGLIDKINPTAPFLRPDAYEQRNRSPDRPHLISPPPAMTRGSRYSIFPSMSQPTVKTAIPASRRLKLMGSGQAAAKPMAISAIAKA